VGGLTNGEGTDASNRERVELQNHGNRRQGNLTPEAGTVDWEKDAAILI